MPDRRLSLLVVEDEALIAMELESILCEAGHKVLGAAATLSRALDLVERLEPMLDAVLLDANLGGQSSLPVARRLADAGIPFVVTSGYSGQDALWRVTGAPHVPKPYDLRQLAAALQVLPRRHTGG